MFGKSCECPFFSTPTVSRRASDRQKAANLRQSLTLERIAELSTTSLQNGDACATPYPRPFALGRRGRVALAYCFTPPVR